MLIPEPHRALALATELADEAVLVTTAPRTEDEEPTIAYVNASFERRCGYTRDELLGQSMAMLHGPSTARHVVLDLRRRLAAGEPVSGTVVNHHKNGQAFVVEMRAAPLRDHDGNVTHIVAVERGQPSRAAATPELHRVLDETRMLLHLVHESGSFGTWARDLDEERVLWSPETYAMFDLPPGSPVTVDLFYALIHPDDHAALRASAARAIAERKPYIARFRVVRPDGGERFLEGRARVLDGEDGRPARMVGIVQDVTERVEVEARLRHSQRMEELGKLAASVAHDYNNMLSGVLGFVRVIEEELPPGTPLHDDLKQIARAAERAAALSDRLLAFGRKQLLAPRLLDLGAECEGMRNLLANLAGEGIELHVVRAPGLPRVLVDPASLAQVLWNLVANARDAMVGRGTLTIETTTRSLDAEAAGAAGLDGAGEYVVLSVSDTGVGMPPDVLAHVFEPFFTTKRGQGSGLGLATVYGIVKQSGGGITVASTPRQGSRFDLFFPVNPGVPIGTPAPSAPLPRQVRLGTVLVVDDELVVRELAARVLRRQGHEVLLASSVAEAEAIASAHARSFDVIVADLVLPDGDGHELARRLRHARPALEEIVTTGYALGAADDASLFDGAAVLRKPLTPDALREAVARALDRRR